MVNKLKHSEVAEDLIGEIWACSPLLGDLYLVSNKGRIKSLNYKGTGIPKLLIPNLYKTGYLMVRINRTKREYIHRLVATAFIPNPNNAKQVNHIDKNKQNNYAENLEWVSQRENSCHGLGKVQGYSQYGRRYKVYIRINGKKKFITSCYTKDDAHQAYLDAMVKYGIENKYVTL